MIIDRHAEVQTVDIEIQGSFHTMMKRQLNTPVDPCIVCISKFHPFKGGLEREKSGEQEHCCGEAPRDKS